MTLQFEGCVDSSWGASSSTQVEIQGCSLETREARGEGVQGRCRKVGIVSIHRRRLELQG